MGEAHARRFVQEGARVMVADVLAKEGAAVAGELGDQGFFEPLDVTDMADWRRVVDATVARWGRVDVLVNNAGILRFGAVEHMEVDEFELLFRVNQLGCFLGMKSVARTMRKNGGGSIVNTSSIEGLGGMAMCAAYSGTKFAIRGMTKSAAMELGPKGVRVNSVHPGIIDTPMAEEFDAVGIRDAIDARIPIGREARPDEVTPTVVFLASDDSGYCTGG